ncbi:Ankyrin repeat domain-containing protein 17, partial [Stegodyphus mimosarum]
MPLDLPTEVALSSGLRSPSASTLPHSLKSSLTNSASPKKWQKRDEGWKEVVRSKLFNRSKKVSVPANAISRVIGRGGMNINAIREASGAHIEVEKQKGQGERTVIIRGSAEATRLAQQLITALIKEPEKELSEILSRYGLGHINSLVTFPESFKTSSVSINPSLSTSAQVSSFSSQNKNLIKQQVVTKTSGNATTSVTKTTSIPPPSLPANATPPFTNQIRSVLSSSQNIRPGIPVCNSATPPFLNNAQNAWTGVVVTGKVPVNVPRPTVPMCTSSASLNVATVSARVVTTTSVEKSPVVRELFPQDKNTSSQPGSTTATKTTVSYTMAVIAQGKAPKTVPANIVTVTTKVTTTSDTKVSTISPVSIERAGSAPPSSTVIHPQMTLGHNTCSGPSPVQPFATNHSPKISNGTIITQQGVNTQARVHSTQAPVQSKPFVNSTVSVSQAVSTSNPPSTSPTGSHTVTTAQPGIAQEYSPFDNIFAQVAQSVWGQKDKEASKPNFASVAASGVTSVASQVQNSNPVQSTLTTFLKILRLI